MINSRDSYTDYNPNKKESIEVPYEIGTIIELKENPNILARICQYRITVEHYKKIIYAGLNTNIYEKELEIECEITTDELKEKWRKTDRIIIGKLDSENFLQIPGFSKYLKKEKKLKLTRDDKK